MPYKNPSDHAAYMRKWRKTHPLTAEQRAKDTARSYANVYRGRGKITPHPCDCGSTEVEMHHEDYARPLEIVWTCRPCHLRHHRNVRRETSPKENGLCLSA